MKVLKENLLYNINEYLQTQKQEQYPKIKNFLA